VLQGSLPGAGVEDDELWESVNLEGGAEVLLKRAVEPHEVEVDASVDLFLKVTAHRIKQVKHCLVFLRGILDCIYHTERSVLLQADVVRRFSVDFWNLLLEPGLRGLLGLLHLCVAGEDEGLGVDVYESKHF